MNQAPEHAQAQGLIRAEPLSDGILLARIDMPGRSMNVFSEPLIDELEALINRVEGDAQIRAVVITSGKSTFLAGADLAMVRGMTQRAAGSTREQMFDHCGRLGRLFLRIEQSAKPWVAAVNGTALGGGLELAMACAARVIDADPKSLLGVPEVKLGLLPGAGGTQRLPRLVGLPLGLDLLVSGRSLNPQAAIKAGLFEAVPSGQSLLAAAQARVNTLCAAGAYQPQAKYPYPTLTAPDDDDTQVQTLANALGVGGDTLRDYPAYRAIIRSVLAGAGLPLPQANDVEMSRFVDLMFDPVAGNMVSTLFIERQRVEKVAAGLATTPPNAVAIGALTERGGTWHEALTRNGVTLVEVAALDKDTIEVPLDIRTKLRLTLATVGTAPIRAGYELTLVLSERTGYGRVMELVTASRKLEPNALGVLAAMARKMQCLLLITPHGGSVLQTVFDAGASVASGGIAKLEAMALTAAALLARGQVADAATLDVALVLAGIAPAYSGGPCRYLAQHAVALRPSLQQHLGDSFAAFERRMSEHIAQEKTA